MKLLNFVFMKNILLITLLLFLSCNSRKNIISNSEILKMPAYNIETSDYSLMESIITSSKRKSEDFVYFKNNKYNISKIDSILNSNSKTEYSLIIKKDSINNMRKIYLIPINK